MIKHAIILPLKENFTNENSGAVSIWVNDYLNTTKFRKNISIFCSKKSSPNETYLSNKNLIPINIKTKYFTNKFYIKEISQKIKLKNINSVEIHNRPEYAVLLLKKNPNIKITLIFHNDPNNLRSSRSSTEKKYLLKNCENIFFVSNFLKKIFYKNIETDHQNNVDVVYNSVIKEKKFPKKDKVIIFSGKLNKLKGYDIFLKSISKILNKFKDWNVEVYGNEPREKYSFHHKRFKLQNWIEHKELLKKYKKAAISIVIPTWEEPFGRTAMESASKGCAVITSISGGLQETFKNNLILKKNNEENLTKMITKLIKNKNFSKKIQNQNLKNPIHLRLENVHKLDNTYFNKKINFYNNLNKFKILHISTFGEKTDHRTFNLSIAKKITNGLIRNGHDVINFDYRLNLDLIRKNLNEKIEKIYKNYKPDMILLGHNNILDRSLLIKLKKNSKISIWYEDHVMEGDPSFKKNIELLEKNHDLIDTYFITTASDIIKTKIKKNKLFFLPIPVDENIENNNFSLLKKNKDVFFAVSHGVNFGKLKSKPDERSDFVKTLIKKSGNNINFNFLGFNDQQPKWNYEYYDDLKKCKMAINLSRGGPSKYCSSNRIASLMGNGVPTLIDEKVKYQDFFNKNEIITYKNIDDLIKKIKFYKSKSKLLKKIGTNAKRKYFYLFNNNIIADYIISKTMNVKLKFKKRLWIK